MSNSHIETFAKSLLPLMVLFFATSQGPQTIPTTLIVGMLLCAALVGSVFTLFMRRRKT